MPPQFARGVLARLSPAAISSSLLLIRAGGAGVKPEEGRSSFCAPLAWVEQKQHDAYNVRRRSPDIPPLPPWERWPRVRLPCLPVAFLSLFRFGPRRR